MISTIANLVYELPHELPNDLRLRNLGLGSQEIRKYQENLKFEWRHSPAPSQTKLDIKLFLFCPVLLDFYFVPNILPRIVGDFNIDLIKANSRNNASKFLDIIYSNYLIPHITSPTRLTNRSHTLIDNVMSNVITEDAYSGNIIYKYNIRSLSSNPNSIISLYYVKFKTRNFPKKL